MSTIVIVLVVIQSLSQVHLFATPWTTACQASLFFTISWSWLRLMSFESIRPSAISFSVAYFSCPQSFPTSGSFPISWLFPSGGQSIQASASVLSMNTQGWFPLGLTVFFLLAVPGTLKSLLQQHSLKASVFRYSAFFMVLISSIHDYWKNHSSD